MRKIKKSNKTKKEDEKKEKEKEDKIEKNLGYYYLLTSTITIATLIMQTFKLNMNINEKVKFIDHEVIDFSHEDFKEVVNRVKGLDNRMTEEEKKNLNCKRLFDALRVLKNINLKKMNMKYGRYCKSKYKEVEEGFNFIFTFISLYDVAHDVLKLGNYEPENKLIVKNIKTILTKIRKNILPWMYYILINNVDPYKKYKDGVDYVNETYKIS